jgi:hypothetical protein
VCDLEKKLLSIGYKPRLEKKFIKKLKNICQLREGEIKFIKEVVLYDILIGKKNPLTWLTRKKMNKMSNIKSMHMGKTKQDLLAKTFPAYSTKDNVLEHSNLLVLCVPAMKNLKIKTLK